MAKLHLDDVLSQDTPGAMRDALNRLPHDLQAAFEKSLDRIKQQPETRRVRAMNALMWVSHARRPLSMLQLGTALAIKPGQTVPPTTDYVPDRRIILESCHGLLETDATGLTVRLVHYTLQDYLVQHSGELFEDAEARMAGLCITCLSYDEFSQRGPCASEQQIRVRLSQYPLLRYSAVYWGDHVKRSKSTQTVKLASAFLSTHTCVANANQISRYCKGFRREYWQLSEAWSTHGLHLAADFGLTQILQAMLEKDASIADVKTEMHTTPLIKAASGGHVEAVKYLLSVGADMLAENRYGRGLKHPPFASLANAHRQQLALRGRGRLHR